MRSASLTSPVAVLGSITEPAHADTCIAVGSTHREAPHAFGFTWTSSKGATLDGRLKPDVVAPGEWITSAALTSADDPIDALSFRRPGLKDRKIAPGLSVDPLNRCPSSATPAGTAWTEPRPIACSTASSGQTPAKTGSET
ncbi:S8 family serine peptidase [Pengzhenrongella sp.]|uniref:S8 family serine peptidase n=1 Tax=Pengzhenrongella sp. TaxID=2888820 RepID=UPI0039C9BA75